MLSRCPRRVARHGRPYEDEREMRDTWKTNPSIRRVAPDTTPKNIIAILRVILQLLRPPLPIEDFEQKSIDKKAVRNGIVDRQTTPNHRSTISHTNPNDDFQNAKQ